MIQIRTPLPPYCSPTCERLHRAGQRLQYCALVIGGGLILMAIFSTIAGVGQVNAMSAMVRVGERSVTTVTVGNGLVSPFNAGSGVLYLFTLGYGAAMAFSGLVAWALGAAAKWFLIGQAETLDRTTRLYKQSAQRSDPPPLP